MVSPGRAGQIPGLHSPANSQASGHQDRDYLWQLVQGATVGTASEAAQRGYSVIVPVDCSAGEDEYHEQYATFHLAKGGPVIVTSKVTMTRSTMIKF
jgi:hypothetical protein